MRILGILLVTVGFAWLTLTQLASSLPKAGNYTSRLKELPVQETYSQQQVRDMVWKISAFRWSFPEQETYTLQQVTNLLFTASMNDKRTRDGTTPSVFAPVLLLLAGTFSLGVGIGAAKDTEPAT